MAGIAMPPSAFLSCVLLADGNTFLPQVRTEQEEAERVAGVVGAEEAEVAAAI